MIVCMMKTKKGRIKNIMQEAQSKAKQIKMFEDMLYKIKKKYIEQLVNIEVINSMQHVISIQSSIDRLKFSLPEE